MRTMTTKKIFLGIALLSMLIVPVLVLGQPVPPPTVGTGGSGWSSDAFEIFNRIINGLFVILMVLAAIAIVVAGYFFLTAGGDPDKVAKARNYVLYALIGVVVAFMARALVLLANWILRSATP